MFERISSGGQMVTMVQAAEPWKRYNRATCNRILLRIATFGCSLRQRKMRSVVVVVTEVLDHQSFQMPFIDNDQMVEQVLATGADPALCDTVLDRRRSEERRVGQEG